MAAEKISASWSPAHLAAKWLRYYCTAANGKGHGIHSPFVFELVIKVLNDTRQYPAYESIESLRQTLRADNTPVEIRDLGAGSAYTSTHTRRIADLAKRAAKPRRLGQLLYRLAQYYRPSTVLELGTSLGLSTAYLAAGTPGSALYTIEGSPAVAARAARNLHSLDCTAEVLTGAFDDILPTLLPTIPPIDLAFVDGNHRLDPTLRYFDLLFRHSSPASVIIFDDIHWSAEMEQAWRTIKNDPRVYLTIDLFFLGLVFRRESFKVKQDFTIRF